MLLITYEQNVLCLMSYVVSFFSENDLITPTQVSSIRVGLIPAGLG
jgi:hypothetical protein